MTNVLIYLIGFAGVGKYTIAKAVSKSIDIHIVDNHYINNPIFALVATDGVTPLPPGVWEQVGKVRNAIFETVATLSPAEWNFIFTNELLENDEESDRVYCDLLEVAERRGATFIPVRLTCETEELCRRVSKPERQARMKDIDTQGARDKSQTQAIYRPKHLNTLELEVTKLSPTGAAAEIVQHIRAISK